MTVYNKNASRRRLVPERNQDEAILWSPPRGPWPVPPVMGVRRVRSTAARRGRRGRLVWNVIGMANMHHPVDRASNHMFQNGPWTDRPMVPIVVWVTFDTEIPVVPSLIAIHSSHNYFLTARFLGVLLTFFLTVVSLGITEIS
jgi:hypothetical protein